MSGIDPALRKISSHLFQRVIPFPDPGPYFRPVTAFYKAAVEQLADLPGQHPVIRYINRPSEYRVLLQNIRNTCPDIFIRQRYMDRPAARAGVFTGTAVRMASVHQQHKQIDAQSEQIRFHCIHRQRQVCRCVVSGQPAQDFRSCITGIPCRTAIDPVACGTSELEVFRAGQHDHSRSGIHHDIGRRQTARQMACPVKPAQRGAQILAHQDPAVHRVNMFFICQNAFRVQIPLQIAHSIADRPAVLIKDHFRPGGLDRQVCFAGIRHHDPDLIHKILCPVFRRQNPGRKRAVFRNDIHPFCHVFQRDGSAGCIFFSVTSCIYNSSHSILS